MRIALVVAAAWALGIAVYAAEWAAGARLPFAYPLIDALAAIALLAGAPTRAHKGHDLAVFIVILLALQALARLGLTPDLPWLLMFVVNRLFEIILLSIWAMAALRIFRRARPDIWGGVSAPLRRNNAPPAEYSGALSPFWRRVHNLFAALHNDERPEAERAALIDKPESAPKGGALAKAKKRRRD